MTFGKIIRIEIKEDFVLKKGDEYYKNYEELKKRKKRSKLYDDIEMFLKEQGLCCDKVRLEQPFRAIELEFYSEDVPENFVEKIDKIVKSSDEAVSAEIHNDQDRFRITTKCWTNVPWKKAWC